MKIRLDLDTTLARLENLAPEFAGDPRQCEDFDQSDFDMYRQAEDGRFVLDTERQAAMLHAGRALQLQAENERLREQASRQTVVDELRRSLRAVGVKPGLVDAAAAMFMQTHKFGFDDTGKVFVIGTEGNASDTLQAAVRFVERDEHADLKARSGSPGRGEFARMVESLQH